MLSWQPKLNPNPIYSLEDLGETGIADTFETRDEAEAWLGANFQELTDLGVEAVTLLDGETEVYTMSLSDPGL